MLTDDEIRALRRTIQGRAKTRTHPEECWKDADHIDCALAMLAADALRHRAENSRHVDDKHRSGWRRCDVPACNCQWWHQAEDPRAVDVIAAMQEELDRLRAEFARTVDLRLRDAAYSAAREKMASLSQEIAWGIIANAGGGDWTKESQEWQEAASRWRDEWLANKPSEAPRRREGS